MKKLIISVLSFLAACTMAFSFAACGTYTPATPNNPDDGKNDDNNNNNNGDEDGEKPFTATLTYGGRIFKPETPISARWNDGSSVYSAEFDEAGVAKVYDLDGDFTVTISDIPEGYTYNANVYTADNDNRDVEIELYKLNTYYGSGTDKYSNVIELTKLGAYRVTFTEAGQQLFCEYRPPRSGTYAIESILDINANEVNPRLDVYVGNAAWKPENPTSKIDGGGVSSVYTKNFKYEVNVANSNNVYSFAVKFDKRSHVEFPINIDFIITRNGEHIGTDGEDETKLMLPTENFKQTPEYSSREYFFNYFGTETGSRIILDGSEVYLAPDGYYHYKYKDRRGVQQDTILYALISAPTPLVDFQNTEVRLGVGNRNYDYFIRGYFSYLITVGGEKNIPADDLEKIKAIDYKSYIDFVNSDGAYAVTPEIKEFLQAFSKREAYFLDGNGWGENNGYDSSEADQWLFACAYYEKR